jgi:hypothetical protein
MSPAPIAGPAWSVNQNNAPRTKPLFSSHHRSGSSGVKKVYSGCLKHFTPEAAASQQLM